MANFVISKVGLELSDKDLYGAFVKCGYDRADGKQGALMRAELMRVLRDMEGGSAWVKVADVSYEPEAGTTKYVKGKEVAMTEEERLAAKKFAARKAELLGKGGVRAADEEVPEEAPSEVPKYVCRDLVKDGWRVLCNAVIRGQRGPSARVHVLQGNRNDLGVVGIIRSDGRVEVVDEDRVLPLNVVMELEGYTLEESWVQDAEGNHYKVLGYKQGVEGFDMQLDICCKGAVWTSESKLEIK